MGKFWEKVLLHGSAADISDESGVEQNLDSVTLANCAAQALCHTQAKTEHDNGLLLTVGNLNLAVLAQEIGFAANQLTEGVTEALREAIHGLDLHQCDLVLMALVEHASLDSLTGVGFVALQRLEDATAQERHIYAIIASHLDTARSVPPVIFEASARGLLTSILSVYHRTSPLEDSRARPWIVPGYDKLHTLNRTAVLQGANPIFVSQHKYTVKARLLTPRNSELFVMQAANPEQLLEKMRSWVNYIVDFPEVGFVDLSYSMSQEFTERGDTRIAIVATSISELHQKLLQAEAELTYKTVAKTPGVFCTATLKNPPKLAFMLPGLGSAYPDMLMDLCLHYPEVREVFDYVDGLALAEGEKTLPSTLLFPNTLAGGGVAGGGVADGGVAGGGVAGGGVAGGGVADGSGTDGNLIGTAMLATMDSAVVTVLLAEWAIFMLLNKFGIKPDALIGCSTGEFAAFTMGGVADIAKAAHMFYKLSVSVARSLPKDRLLNLASIKVDAGGEAFDPIIKQLSADLPLYVTAEFTQKHSIVTGSKIAIAQFTELLRESGIEFHYLPVAIPYHTPLVEGTVSSKYDEVVQLQLSAPAIPIWSCASAAPYGADIETMRRTTTELFAKTIMFERTIKAAHASGMNTFVEVGPRDNLASFAREIFLEQNAELDDSRVLCSDVMGRNSLTQMNCLLAELFCLGFDIDFSVLFENREVKRVDSDRTAVAAHKQSHVDAEQVLLSYMAGLESYHKQLMDVQTKVLNEYLASK